MAKGPDREVTLQDVWDLMELGKPETTSTLTEELPCSKDTVYSRLEELEDKDYIESKDVSAQSKVYWKPTHNTGIVPDEIQPDTQSEKDPAIIGRLAEAKRTGEPMTSGDIAEYTGENKDTIYQRLRKLEELGWVNSFKTGATGKVWWLAEVDSNREQEQTTLSISPALKIELKRVREEYDEPQKLEEALIFAIKYPDVTNHQLEGDEKGVSPIKVSKLTLEHLSYIRDNNDYTSYEEVIRDSADIAYRKMNTRSVTRTPPECAVIEEHNDRERVYSGSTKETIDSETQSGEENHPFERLGDDTTVRHKYRRGDYSGDVVKGEVQGEEIIVEGDDEARSPSGAAKFADNRHRGDDAREGGWNGWEWWEFQNDDGEWVELLNLTNLAE